MYASNSGEPGLLLQRPPKESGGLQRRNHGIQFVYRNLEMVITKMDRRFFRACSLALIAVFGLTACSTSTKLTQSWQEPTYGGPALGKILIIGLSRDDINRRFFEDEFSRELSESGIQAVPSYTLIPHPEDHADKDKLEATVAQAGVDGVLVAELKSVDKEDKYVPPRVDWVPGPVYGGYYGYYYPTYRQVYSPGYTKQDTIARVEIRLFTVSENQLIWGARTETVNPDSVKKAVQQLADIATRDLKGRGLVK